jgi:hypothetical protein
VSSNEVFSLFRDGVIAVVALRRPARRARFCHLGDRRSSPGCLVRDILAPLGPRTSAAYVLYADSGASFSLTQSLWKPTVLAI